MRGTSRPRAPGLGTSENQVPCCPDGSRPDDLVTTTTLDGQTAAVSSPRTRVWSGGFITRIHWRTACALGCWKISGPCRSIIPSVP